MITLYRIGYFLAKCLVLLLKPFLNSKLKDWIELRNLELPNFTPDHRPVFLFHASSGEVEYVKSIIRSLKENQVQIRIVLTYSSPSAPRLFENIKTYIDDVIPIPWDQRKPLGKLFDLIRPDSVIFARTDLWPEMIHLLSERKIKTYVVSYNPNFGFMNRVFIRHFLKTFKGIFCVHPHQAEFLKQHLPWSRIDGEKQSVEIAAPGDTRYDQVFWRLAQPSKVTVELFSRYAVWASTWNDDERFLIPTLEKTATSERGLIWAPHEVDSRNIERIQKLLGEKNISFQVFSKLNQKIETLQPRTRIILMDQVGYLADLYRKAEFAFVGGSYKEKVHSVMEPLCCAIPVITGPNIFNSPEAQRYNRVTINNVPVVQITNNSDEILAALDKIESLQIPEFKKLLIGQVEKNRNATRLIVHSLVRMTQESLNS